MLERLTIRNFQVHRTLELQFDPQITTIVGPSDVGKSAVLRALRWVCTNRPAGEQFRRHRTKRVRVKLVVDGREITRVRGDRNEYHLDGQVLKAFASEVPTDISRLLNVGDLNFQWQHDAPFWFSLSPGLVAKELNQIINLQDIDEAQRIIIGEVRSARAQADAASGRLAKAIIAKRDLKWIIKADRTLARLERLKQTHQAKLASAGSLQSLLEEVAKAGETKRRTGNLPDITTLAGTHRRLRTATVQRDALRDLLDQIDKSWGVMAQATVKAADSAKLLAKERRCPTCGTKLSPLFARTST